MKYIRMKIRDHFINLIKNGTKKHEYRLAAPKYADIYIGDVLVLISNQNKDNYIKVFVDSIETFKSWDDALCNYWESDFKGLYNSLSDILKECREFYAKEEVEKYGIKVFSIKPYVKSLKQGRYLFDTNTIIEKESFNNASSEVAMCYLAIDKLNGQKFIHEKTISEIEKHKGENTKINMLTKLKAYQHLISCSKSVSDFESVCSKFALDENSQIDNEILLQVYNGNVDFLITSDKKIIKKAKLLYLNDCVLSPNDLLKRVDEENPKLVNYDVLSIELVDIGTLDINDNFFNSLRDDYGVIEFNNWLRKKSNKQAYVFKNNEGLQGFLYLKIEDENEDYTNFKPIFKPAKRLKIGTFKIVQSGMRLGERFLKIIFDNAIKSKVDEIYVTMFEEKRPEVMRLRALLEEWGFVETAINIKNGEVVLVKKLNVYDKSKSPKFNYPSINTDVRYMMLPIASEYHTKLFPDLHLKNETLCVDDEGACGYAIEKIYVCGWKKIEAYPGDIVCIYRMGEYYKTYTSVITGTAILNEVIYPKDEAEYIKICKNKSVFSEEQLRTFFRNKKYQAIIKVLYYNRFDFKVNLKSLYDNCIITKDGPGPRINTFIDKKHFDLLTKLGKELS